MKRRTLFMLVALIFVIFFVQNRGPVTVIFLFSELHLSKLLLLPGLVVVGFAAGYLSGRRRRRIALSEDLEANHDPYNSSLPLPTNVPRLSQEDRDYIN